MHALSAIDAIILGLVEGITEFLPVSSTGHLIIANHFLGLESDAANTYIIVLQFGAIAAVAILYWRSFVSMIRGVLGRDMAGLRLAVRLVIAFIPAAVLGLLFHDMIEKRLFTPVAVIVAQVAGAGLMFYAEAWRKRKSSVVWRPVDMDRIGLRKSAGIGLLQCLSLWPGMSRSMTVIVGGYFAGLDARAAAEFSFLLGFITLGAASAYKAWQGGSAMVAAFGWSNILLGAVVAAVSAAISVRFLVRWLTHHGLTGFAIYRILLAATLAAWLY